MIPLDTIQTNRNEPSALLLKKENPTNDRIQEFTKKMFYKFHEMNFCKQFSIITLLSVCTTGIGMGIGDAALRILEGNERHSERHREDINQLGIDACIGGGMLGFAVLCILLIKTMKGDCQKRQPERAVV